jgi:phosphoglucosamine mutase
VLINVKEVDKERLPASAAIKTAVKNAESELGNSGRVLLRASGTENLVRVMVEASSDNLAHKIANDLVKVVKAELG